MQDHIEQVKIYAINGGALLFSLSDMEQTFKIISLLVAIGYTARRWWIMERERVKAKKNVNNE